MLVYSASSLETNQQRRLRKTICSLIHSTCRILNPIYVITWMLLPCFFSFQALEQLHELEAKQSVSVLQLWMAA